MQSSMPIQGLSGEYIIQPTSLTMESFYVPQDISPGNAGLPSPPDSCSMYSMGLPMQLQQAGGFPSCGLTPVGIHGLYPRNENILHPLHQQNYLRCRRKVDLTRLGFKSHPTAVARRNERERNRVKHINSTFSSLRQHLPSASKNKKMSKVETLRSAIKYIKHLSQILNAQDEEEEQKAIIKCEEDSDTQSPDSTTNAVCSEASREHGGESNARLSTGDSDTQSQTDSLNSSSGNSSYTESTSSESICRTSTLSYGSELNLQADDTPCSSRNRSSSASTQSVNPGSPSSSVRSVSSPANSTGYSSEDPVYDTYTSSTQDDIDDFINWI